MPLADRPRVVDIPALPEHAALGLVRHDRAFPACRAAYLGDPALAPRPVKPDPGGRVPGTCAPLPPAGAGPGPPRISDAHHCQYPKPSSISREPCQLGDDQVGGAARVPALARRLRDDGRAAIKLVVGATALRCSRKP